MKKKLLITCFLMFIILNIVSSEKLDIPFNINYYGISPGAEALGMGYAFSSGVSSPAMVFWNPANISLLEKAVIYIDFAKYDSVDITDLINYENGLKGARIDFFSIVYKDGGISWHPISKSFIEDSIIIGGDTTTYLKASSHIDEFIFTFTSMLGNKNYSGPIYYGFNLKYYNGILAYGKSIFINSIFTTNNIEIDYGHGFGSDFSILYDAKKLKTGLTINNVFSRVLWGKHKTGKIPTRFNLSLAVIPTDNFGIGVEVTKFTISSPFIFAAGIRGNLSGSKWYNNFIYSAGAYADALNFIPDNTIYSVGLGYNIKNLRINTSVSGYISQFTNSFNPEYRISISTIYDNKL